MRAATAGLLVLLATLVAPLAIAAAWTASTVDSTDAYVELVEPLADDPELRERLGDEVATAVTAELEASVPVGLPDAVGDQVRAMTDMVIGSDAFPSIWRRANNDVHREFRAFMHSDRPASGWITVDLAPLAEEVIASLGEDGLPVQLIAVPDIRLPVVPEDRLADYREPYRLGDAASLWLPAGWAALVVLAVLVAPGWRGRAGALGAAAIGLAVAAVAVRLAAPPAADRAIDTLETGQQGLVDLVADVVVDDLAGFATTIALVGGAVGLVLVLTSLVPRRTHR